MKKLLILTIAALVGFSTNSCKKKECPKPEVWGVGIWKMTEYYDNGVLQDASDPAVGCLLQETIQLNDDAQGTWTFTQFDGNTNTCTPDPAPITSWAENLDKKTLMVTIHLLGVDLGEEFIYENKDKMYHQSSSDKFVFEKQ